MVTPPALRNLDQRHGAVEPDLGQLARKNGEGERRAIDGHSQARPQVGNGAQVILVGVGQQDAV